MVGQEIIAGRDCPICGGSGEIIGEKMGHEIRECLGKVGAEHASMGLSWAWDSEEEYEKLYSMDYHTREQKREGQRSFWQRDTECLVAGIERFRSLETHNIVRYGVRGNYFPKALDVGCGTGAMLPIMESYGFTTLGIEPNVDMTKAAQGLGRNVIHGTWRDIFGEWELITMFDVFEHLTRPMECLAVIRENLKPGGLLVVEFPAWNCPQHVQDGLDWKHIRPRQHLFLPSRSAACMMFELAGFDSVRILLPKGGVLGKISCVLMKPRDEK